MHGIAIGQVLLDARYIENVMENQGDFVDGNYLYRFCPVFPNRSNKNVKDTKKIRKFGKYYLCMYDKQCFYYLTF